MSEFAQFITSDLLVNSFTEELVESLETVEQTSVRKRLKLDVELRLWVYREDTDMNLTRKWC